jgi:pimeloyl-ACP methyl ester carboxylesterase
MTTMRARRTFAITAFVVALALAVSACGSDSGSSASSKTTTTSTPRQRDIAGTFDIGGRKMYLECAGQGSPTVILIPGGGIAADLWDSPLGEQPTVYPTIAETTRVCSYDRPGTTRARAEGGFSRSDPVPQPITPSRSVDELHALLKAADQHGPFVLAAHSYGGLVARLYANEHPEGDHWSSWLAWAHPCRSTARASDRRD